MRLKSNIFLWVSLATVIPLTVLSLAATAYSERLYLIEVGKEVARNMNNTLSEIDRQLYYERQMVISLANSQARAAGIASETPRARPEVFRPKTSPAALIKGPPENPG